MALDSGLQFAQAPCCGALVAEQRPVDLDGTVLSSPSDHHRVPVLVPFQERTRPYTKSSPNLDGYRYLSLRRYSRSCDWHGLYITTVMPVATSR